MKKTVTKAYSLPKPIAEEIENIAKELQISGSAVTTAILTLAINWIKGGTKDDLKTRLNSIYGKKG